MKYFSVGIVFATLICTGLALDCFQCNSASDPLCADDFDSSSDIIKTNLLKPCNTTETYCKKVKMWLTGETRIQRKCGTSKREDIDTHCYQTRADDHIVDTCACDHEGCNGASATTAGAALIACLAALRLL